ncbi:maturation protein [ssRNA phage Gerhypos.1_41]|uniref:Maturation protein n=2 Tax=Norzivirales TaxID=2842247 RepID=A0A8S5KYG8_9VIRU|nr:maturation protein [ssRNA phage Gerhypos.1_41]QDH88766.1 MAG: hypothetical protein H1Bulk30212_000002 [Leviviridae sp.]DAD50352.1 TPA_asm: maturation protein [ssRNA phage Gerhypos.1_41]
MEAYHKTEHVANFYDFHKKRRDNIGGFDFSVSDNVGSNLSFQNSLSGVKNPFWKSQIRSGIDATTAMSATKMNIKNSYFFGTRTLVYDDGSPIFPKSITDTVKGVYPYDPGLPIGPPPGNLVSRVHARCVQKFIQNCETQLSSLSSGQDFGELKETLHAMTSPLTSMRQLLVRTFTSLKKRRLPRMSLRDAEKVVTDTYLEFTFGWNPLAADVAAAYVGFTSNGNHFEAAPVEASASESYNGSNILFASPFNLGTFAVRPGTEKRTSLYTERLKGAIRTHSSGDHFEPGQVLGLTPHNFIPTLWELLPYSFVVDYFSNIGAVIQGLCFPFSDLSWACGTTRQEDTVVYTPGSYDQWNPLGSGQTLKSDSGYSGGGNANFSCVTVSRYVVLPADLLASVQFRLPLSEKPWENIAALIASNTRGLVPYIRGNK